MSSGKSDGSPNSSSIQLKKIHIVIAFLLWLVVFVLVIFVLVKAFSTSAELNQDFKQSEINELRQRERLDALNSSLQAIEETIKEHDQRLGEHMGSLSRIGSENNEQNNDLNDLRNSSQQLSNQLNHSIYDRMMENLQHQKSAQQLNDSVNDLKAQNENQNEFAKNLSDHVNHLEDQQNVSSIEFVLDALKKNRVLQNLNNSIQVLQTDLDTNVGSLNSKNQQQDSNLTKVNNEMKGLVEAINVCQAGTCQHGICKVDVNDYTCHCQIEYMGRNCSEGRCKEGWKFYKNNCYNFVRNDRSTWSDAEAKCVRDGGHLTSVLNQAEDTFIQENVRVSSWIGLNDRSREGNYQWVDRSAYRFSDWAPGEPGDSNGQEDCTFMWNLRSYKWNDDRCRNLKNFICKARAKGL